jgi:hypothetical protein
VSHVDGKRVGFAGESAEVDAVIWATGYIGTMPTGWRSPRPRTSTGITFISAVSLNVLAVAIDGGLRPPPESCTISAE